MSSAEMARSIVTRQQIRHDFGAVDRRAQEGVYPGYGPRKLYEIEMDALRSRPDCSVLWEAASGANQSLARTTFIDSGGFHPGLTINEHRELALRLCKQGLKMAACTARTYHMIHRSGWRDPLEDLAWENIFYEAHPLPEVALMPLLWSSLSDSTALPEASRILTLRISQSRRVDARGYSAASGFEKPICASQKAQRTSMNRDEWLAQNSDTGRRQRP